MQFEIPLCAALVGGTAASLSFGGRVPVAGRTRVVQWVLIGGPYTVWSHRRQVRLPYVLAGLGLVTA
jgi:hypothetical protein